MPQVESQEITQNQSQEAAKKMYEIADKNASMGQSALYDTYNRVGTEFAQANYHKGQQLLEKTGAWSDELRDAATRANRLEIQKADGKSMSFQEAQTVLNRNTKELASLGDARDKRDAAETQTMVAGMSRPGEQGIKEIEKTLGYIEGLLQTRATSQRQMTPEIKQKWNEHRAVRDAVFAEKQARMENNTVAQRASDQRAQEQTSIVRFLENLYSQAGIGENVPSRQEMLSRASAMSEEELHFLNAELKKVGTQFNRSSDQKALDASLTDLATKKFTKDTIIKRNRESDETEARNIRAKLTEVQTVAREKETTTESPRERYQKHQNYETHRGSAERLTVALRDVKDNFENSNSVAAALMLFEGETANLTLKANSEDIEAMRGKAVDEKERAIFDIPPEHWEDYKRMREVQNSLASGRAVKEVMSVLEKKLSDTYGIQRINLESIKTVKDLRTAKISADLFPQETNRPELAGVIKEVQRTGYHIPDVPQYNVKGEQIGKFNQDIKARPFVAFYKLKS